MIKDYFIFGGINSGDYGVIVEEAAVFDKPAASLSTVKVPGRNGDLILYENRFENVKISYKCHCDYHFRSRLDGLIKRLSSQKGYKRLEDSVYPKYFRRAYFQGPVSPKLLRTYRAGSFQLSFAADPRKFLKTGEIAMPAFTAAGVILNEHGFDALPLIRCYGTSGTVTINGVAVTVTGCTSYVDIDCDLMETYEGSTSRNGTTTLVNGEFPVLSDGENTVSFTGFSRVEITPRWWIL